MKKFDFYNKLVIDNDSVMVKRSELMFSFQKIMLYILITFVLVFSLVLTFVVKDMALEIKLVLILFMIGVILLYKFYYLKIAIRDFDKDWLIIKNGILSYYIEDVGYLDIPLNLISLIEDKSEYDSNAYRHEDHYHGGWSHKIVLYFNHFDTYYNNLDDKYKRLFRFNKKNNTLYLQITGGLGLSHEKHTELIGFIKITLQKQIEKN